MKKLIYILIGFLIGIGGEMLRDHWETIMFKRTLGCSLGWPYSILKKTSFDGIGFTLWGANTGDGHALIVYSDKFPYHTIIIKTSVPTNTSNEIISMIEIDDSFSFFGSSNDGQWSNWTYNPDSETMYVYKLGDGNPNTIYSSEGIHCRVEDQMYKVIDDGTNAYIKIHNEKVRINRREFGKGPPIIGFGQTQKTIP